ncbi:MAG: hypothetical protein KDJ99_27245 [Candidatus Competibacteraceae bacterium]|nr:hypothetical protein [Candidatus Competibacteraceae bacterium]
MAKGLKAYLADAVTDIRQKVVEEPWFGREVTERKNDWYDPEGDKDKEQQAATPYPPGSYEQKLYERGILETPKEQDQAQAHEIEREDLYGQDQDIER